MEKGHQISRQLPDGIELRPEHIGFEFTDTILPGITILVWSNEVPA